MPLAVHMMALGLTPQDLVAQANASASPLYTFLQSLTHIGGYKEDPLQKKSVLLAIILSERPERFLKPAPHEVMPPIIDYHLQRSDEVFLSYMELRNLSDENFEKIQLLRRRYEAELEEILSDGHAAEDFRLPDVRVSTMALIAMLNGVSTWYREDGRLSRDRIQRIYWNMAKRMVRA